MFEAFFPTAEDRRGNRSPRLFSKIVRRDSMWESSSELTLFLFRREGRREFFRGASLRAVSEAAFALRSTRHGEATQRPWSRSRLYSPAPKESAQVSAFEFSLRARFRAGYRARGRSATSAGSPASRLFCPPRRKSLPRLSSPPGDRIESFS